MSNKGNPAVFLETLNGPTTPAPEALPVPQSVDPALSLIGVLSKLADGQAKPILDLQVDSALEFSAFAPTIDTLVKAGLVTVQGPPGQEEVQISEAGRALTAASPTSAPASGA
jgi:hypothetical protein